MFAAETAAYFRQRGMRQRLTEVHRNLPRHRDRLGVVARFQIDEFKVVVIGDELLDDLDRDRLFFVVQDVLQHFVRKRQRDFLTGERGIRDQPDQRALQLANIRFDLSGDVDGDVVGQRHRFCFGLLLQNCDLGLQIGRLDIGNESPLEPRSQPLLELPNLVRRTIAAKDDLLL